MSVVSRKRALADYFRDLDANHDDQITRDELYNYLDRKNVKKGPETR